MSNRLTALAWRTRLGNAAAKSVLVRLCDFADDDGRRVFPAVPTVARDCDLGERTVQEALRRLEAAGLLILVREADFARRRAREYRIDVEALEALAHGGADTRCADRTGAHDAPAREPHRCGVRTQPVRQPHRTGAGAASQPPWDPPRDPAADERARLVAVGMEVLRLIGVADDPRWLGNYGRVGQWLANGADPELDIFSTIRRVMARRGAQGPPASLSFFDRPIADALASRTQPLPPGDHHDQHRQVPRQPRRNAWAVAAERLAESRTESPDGAGDR